MIKRRPNMRWIDCMKEVIGMNLQQLSKAIEGRTLWTSLIHTVPKNWSQLNSVQHMHFRYDGLKYAIKVYYAYLDFLYGAIRKFKTICCM